MSKLCAIVAVMSAVFAADVPCLAQGYARQTGDTLRYEETTLVDVLVSMPQGTVPVTATHDADILLTHTAPDTMRAWYRELSVRSETPMGIQEPRTDAVVGEPFVVLMSPKGETHTLSAPEVPDVLRGVSDVERQFDDFFLILPDEPLAVGVSWNYETGVDAETDDGGRHAFRKWGRLTVVGDTLIDGHGGLKIVGDLDATMSATRRAPQTDATVINEFSGVETNIFVFSPERGALLYRQRSAELSGESTIEGGPAPMTMQQEIEYKSELRLAD